MYDATPTVVYVGYTPGYQGAIIYNGVVVYGTGYYYTPWIGTYWYGPPVTYGFGLAIGYSPWTGWAYGFGYGCGWGWGHVTIGVGWGWGGWGWGCAWGGWYGGWHGGYYGAAWGVHGGAVWGPGYARWSTRQRLSLLGRASGVSRSGGGYNAWTGNAWHGQSGAAYNSKTGTLAAGQRGSVGNVYTGNYATGGRGVATNTKTGTTVAARGGTVGNAYTGNSVSGGQAKVYNPNTGNTTKVGGVTSSNGGSAARVGDTAVGKTSSGDYYATPRRQRLQEHRRRLAAEDGLERLVERQRPGEDAAALEGELGAHDRTAALRQLPVQRRRLAQPEQLGQRRLAPDVAAHRRRRGRPPPVAPLRCLVKSGSANPHRGVAVPGLTAAGATGSAAVRRAGTPRRAPAGSRSTSLRAARWSCPPGSCRWPDRATRSASSGDPRGR